MTLRHMPRPLIDVNTTRLQMTGRLKHVQFGTYQNRGSPTSQEYHNPTGKPPQKKGHTCFSLRKPQTLADNRLVRLSVLQAALSMVLFILRREIHHSGKGLMEIPEHCGSRQEKRAASSGISRFCCFGGRWPLRAPSATIRLCLRNRRCEVLCPRGQGPSSGISLTVYIELAWGLRKRRSKMSCQSLAN